MNGNPPTFAQQWEVVKGRLFEKMKAEGVTDLAQAEQREKKALEAFSDYTLKQAKQRALAQAYAGGIKDRIGVEGEGKDARFVTYDEKLDEWSDLVGEQYLNGKKQITWDDYSRNDRGAAVVLTENVVGDFFLNNESFLSQGIGTATAEVANLAMKLGIFDLPFGLGDDPASREWVAEQVYERMTSGTNEVVGGFLRAASPTLRELVGEDPNAPERKSERVGTAGHTTAASAGQDVGQALGGAGQSVPLMLIRDPVIRGIATLPYFVMGKRAHQSELLKMDEMAREQARRLGVEYEGKTPTEREWAGIVQGGAEWLSEYIFDWGQRSALGIDKMIFKKAGKKWFQKAVRETISSASRHRGPAGFGKKLLEGAARVGASAGLEGAEEFVAESVKAVNVAVPEGWEYEWISEDAVESAYIGSMSGGFLGIGTTGLGMATEGSRNRAMRRQLQERGLQADMTQALEERGQQEGLRRFGTRQTLAATTPAASRDQTLINFNRNIPMVRGQSMARYQIEEMMAGNRLAMFVDPTTQRETITSDLKDMMTQAGIVKIGTHKGRAVYGYAAWKTDIEQLIQARDSAAINGYADTSTSELLQGAVVLRNDAGEIVHVFPYSDPDDIGARIPAIVADADAYGLTVEDVEPGNIGGIADQVQRQVDADATRLGLPRQEQRPQRPTEVTRGITAIRRDVGNSIKGRLRESPDARFTGAEVSGGPVRNRDVKVKRVVLSRADPDSYSPGESRIMQTAGGRANILQGSVEYEITRPDGSTETVSGVIPMDGAYVSQSNPDGVYLIRENGDAMTARSAFMLAWHELRHKALATSRAGSAHMARLLAIDPVFAARGGAEYMRIRYGDLNGLSDLEVAARLQGLAQAARATLASPTATAQEQTQARGDIARFQQFAEESVATTSNRAVGQMTELAAQHEAFYRDRSDRSMQGYAAWLANALVRNGVFGPEARQVVHEVRQMVQGVRAEEMELHGAMRENAARSAREALQQGQSRAAAAATSAAAAPAVAPVGAALGALAGDGEDEEKKQIPEGEPQASASLLGTAARGLAAVAQYAGMPLAQVGGIRIGRKGPAGLQRPTVTAETERQVSEEPPAPIEAPAVPVQPLSEIEAFSRRQRNEEQARRILSGMAPTQEIDVGSVSRALRAKRYETPEQEAMFSMRGRPGRQAPNEEIRSLRNRYMQERGIEPEVDVTDQYAEVNEDFAKRLADWYESAQVNYTDPEMLAAYSAFGRETLDQYRFLRDSGIDMVPWAGQGQPYANSEQMMRDLRDNRRLFYFKTVNPEEAQSFGSDPAKFADQVAKNPLLADSGITVLDSAGEPYRQTYNDLFRAVHDVFGHGGEGFQFGPRGEENAYRSHAVMFSPQARGAMATETRTQNSWVNYGPNRRNPDGTVWGQEDPRYQKWISDLNQGTGYADQKAVVTPPEFQALYSMRQQPISSARPPRARGNQAMINRINQQVSRGRMSQEDADFGIELIRRVDQNAPVALSFLGPKAMEKETGDKRIGGIFYPATERILVATKAIKEGNFREVFTHELWHSLTRFVPDAIVKRAARDYRRAYTAFVKKHGIEPRDFHSTRKDKATGKTRRDLFIEEAEKRGLTERDWYRLVDLDEWLVVNAAEVTEERMDAEKDIRDLSGPTRLYAMANLLIRDFLTSVKNAFGYGTYEKLARDFLRGTSIGMASQPDVAWESAEGRMNDLYFAATERQRAAEEARIGEMQGMRPEAQAVAMTPFEAQFSMREQPTPTEEQRAARTAAETEAVKEQAKAVPVKARPTQRLRTTSPQSMIGLAPSGTLSRGMRTDATGRTIDPVFAQRMVAKHVTSVAVKRSISQALAKIGTGFRDVEVVEGIWGGQREVSLRIVFDGEVAAKNHRMAEIIGSAFMQDAVVTVAEHKADGGMKTQAVSFAIPNPDAENRAGELERLASAMHEAFGGATIVTSKNFAFVVNSEKGEEKAKEFDDNVRKVAAQGFPFSVVDVSFFLTETGNYNEDTSAADGGETGGRVQGSRLAPEERDPWLDVASAFVAAIDAEGIRVDTGAWLRSVEPDPAKRESLERDLWKRVADRNGVSGAYGVHGRYLTRYDGDVEGLIYERGALVADTVRDFPSAYQTIDALLDKHPDAMRTVEGWQRFAVELYQSRTIPIAPTSHIERIANGHAKDRERLRLITDDEARSGKVGITAGQLKDAKHGMDNASAMRAMYESGKMKPKHTVMLMLWGFLSRGVSPNVQESMLLDIVNFRYTADTLEYAEDVITGTRKTADGWVPYGDDGEGKRIPVFLRKGQARRKEGSVIETRTESLRLDNRRTAVQSMSLSEPLSLDYFVDLAMAGKWDRQAGMKWSGFIAAMADSIAFPQTDATGNQVVVDGEPQYVNGSFGAGSMHNANAFGRNFLANVANVVTIDGRTASGIDHLHRAMSEPNATGDSVRRTFQQLDGSLGIDNKVVSFNALVSGIFGIVADRVFLRLAYNADNRLEGNIYDGSTVGWRVYRNGEPFVTVRNVNYPGRSGETFDVEAFDERDFIIDEARAAVGLPALTEEQKRSPTRDYGKELNELFGLANNRRKSLVAGESLSMSVAPINIGGMNSLWDGVRGIAYYKAFERSIDLNAAFGELIRQDPDFKRYAHMGMYHWLPWVIDSQQEASHQTVEAIMRMAQTGDSVITQTYAKAGKYNSFHYGAEYGYELVDDRPQPRYRLTLPDGVTREFSPADFKKFIETVKSPKSGVVPRKTADGKRWFISKQTGPWYESPDMSPENKAALYRVANETQTKFSVRSDYLRRQEAMRTFAALDPDDDLLSRVSMRIPKPSLKSMSAIDPATGMHPILTPLFDASVRSPFPLPTTEKFVRWNRGNVLTSMFPNGVVWHGSKHQFARYDEKPYELGFHVGTIQQAYKFVRDGWLSDGPGYLMPLYAVSRNPLRLPDMGAWNAGLVLDGMLRLKVLPVEEIEMQRGRLSEITRREQANSDGSTWSEESFTGRTVFGDDVAQRQWIIEYLESLGYDSIVYQNTHEGVDYSKAKKYDDPEVVDARERGEDESVVHRIRHGANDSVVLWNYGNVKSLHATQFDLEVPVVSYSLRTESRSPRHEANSLVIPAQFSMRAGVVGVKDQAVLQVIDQYDEVLRLQRSVEARTATALPDASNPYLGMRTLTGRLGSMQQVASRRYSEILRDMAEHGISLEQMDDFLTAQHAINGGNAYIATINPAFPDGGTGMTNADARDVIMRAQAAGRYGHMNRIAEDWRDMLRDSLQLRLDSGLITRETYDILTTRYTHYVPLRGAPARPEDEAFEAFDEAMRGQGGGLSTTGRGMPRRLGRRSRAEGVTSQVGFMHEETFRRAARNEIGNRFANLVLALNDPTDAEVIRPTRRYLDRNGVMRVGYDEAWRDNPRLFGLYVNRRIRVNGHTYDPGDLMVIRITNPRLAAAMKQPKTDIGLVGQAVRRAGDVFRFFTTGMGAPEFAPINMLRDVLTGAMVNYLNRGARDTAAMMVRWPGSFARVFADSWNGRPTGAYAAMQQAGGDMMAWHPNDLELKRIDFDRLAQDAQARDPNVPSVARRLMGWYPAFFSAAETATRLAQFQQRIATGSTPEQAGLAARDVTVDFAKGGIQKTLFNTWYMFLNAGLQGNANIIRGIRANPRRGAALASSLVTLGLVQAIMARMLAGEDEESGLNRWDMVKDYDKASKLFFFDPTGSGRYVSVPLSYGFNALVTTGVRVADSVFGPKRPSEAVLDVISDYMNAFNPMGGSGITSGQATAFNAMVPTVFRPAAEIATNQKFSGSPIYRDSFGKDVVDSATYFDNTGPAYIALAEGINEFTGGDEFASGMVDVSPNTLEYLVGYYLSGMGRTVNRTMKVASGDFTVADVPIARSFVGQAGTDNAAIAELYYGEEAKSMPAMRRAKAAADETRTAEERAAAAIGIDPIELGVGVEIQNTEKTLRKVREAMKAATPEQRANLMKVRQSVMKKALSRRAALTAEARSVQ